MSEKLSAAKQKNIIWILCDSVRVYHTDKDERGRLPAMDSFALDAVDFRSALTAAPSTIMSVSSMLTSLPSIYLSRDYNSFLGQQGNIQNGLEVLRSVGYSTYGLLFWPDGRQMLEPMFGDVCKDLVGDEKDESFHSNDTMLSRFQDFLNSDRAQTPFFSWLHLNCRNDPELSLKVEDLMRDLKRRNLYDDSIIVLNSDHGYPDVNRGISFYGKRKYGHDLIMTDDNVLAPQLIKFPGIPARRIEFQISTLDIFPTILDYLNLGGSLDTDEFPIRGESVLDIIKNSAEREEKIHRSDNRYIFQRNAVTCLRSESFKIIHYLDEGRYEFYDLKNDPLETENIFSNQEYSFSVGRFCTLLAEQHEDALAFHAAVLSERLKCYSLNRKKLVLVGDFNKNFSSVYERVLGSPLSQSRCGNVDVLTQDSSSSDELVIAFPCTKDHFLNAEICRVARRPGSLDRKSMQVRFSNYNLDEIKPPRHWIWRLLEKPSQYWQVFMNDPKTAVYNVYLDSQRLVGVVRRFMSNRQR